MSFLRMFFISHPAGVKRFFEITIPLLSWGVITMPIWLSFWHPAIASYFVVFFVVYWFYKSAVTAFYGLKSYLTLRAHVQVDWLSLAKKREGFDTIHHLVIIPEYKEPLHILEETMNQLSKQDFPTKKISICLATEYRDVEALKTTEQLVTKFRKYFANICISRHKLTS